MPLDSRPAVRAAAVLCAILGSLPVSAQPKTAAEVPVVANTSSLGQAGAAAPKVLLQTIVPLSLQATPAPSNAVPLAAPVPALPAPAAVSAQIPKSAQTAEATLTSPSRMTADASPSEENAPEESPSNPLFNFDEAADHRAMKGSVDVAARTPADARPSGLSRPTPKLDPAQDSLVKNHESMTRGRNFGSYVHAFDGNFGTGDFSRSIAALSNKPGARWLDSGGGEGIATAQLMAHPGYEGLATTVVSYETSAQPGPRRQVIAGRFLQDIRQEELGKNDLITDVIGVLAYTYDFMSDFKKLHDALTPNGELYVFMASSVRDFYGRDNKVLVDGRVMTLADFLQTIPGLDVKLVKTPLYDQNGTDVMGEVWNVRVKRTPGVEPKWPQLETIYFKEGNRAEGEMVPQRMFAVKGSRLNAKALDALSADARRAYAGKTRREDAESFFNKFRGITGWINPLMNRLLWLKKGQSWALEGPNGSRVASELRTGVRFTDPAFIRPSQWFMEFLSRRIHAKTLSIGTHDKKPTVFVVDDGITSYRLSQDMERWVASVPDGGEIWLSLGLEKDGTGTSTRILTEDGRRFGIRGWLETIPGLRVTDYRGHRIVGRDHEEPVFVRIVVPDHAKVRIPALAMLGAGEKSGDGVKIPLYRETAPR